MVQKFYNATGQVKSDVVIADLGNLIAKEPKAVVVAIQNAGISLPLNSSKASITKTILENSQNKRLIENLSAVVILNENYNELFGKGKKGGATPPATGGTGDKTGFFKKIGNFFKRPTNPDGTKGKSQFGNWFNRNKGTMGDVGNALTTTLAQNRLAQGNTGQGNTGQGGFFGGQMGANQNNQGGNVKPPMSMGMKIAIGGGVLLVIVGVVLVMRKKK